TGQLAKYLDLPADNLPEGGELNEVACRYLSTGGMVEDIYAALKTVAGKAEALPIPEPLLQLAEIRPFQLFLTTTFDSCLVRALNQVRFGGNPRTCVCAYSPDDREDLANALKSDDRPIVYQPGFLAATTPR